MDFGKILKAAAIAAAPIAATAVAGPQAGVVTAAALAGGKGGKYIGMKIEGQTGVRAQKITAPIAAVGLPLAFAPLLSPDTVGRVCEFIQSACTHQESVVALLLGVLAVLGHQSGDNLSKLTDRR